MGPGAGNVVDGTFFQYLDGKIWLEQRAQLGSGKKSVCDPALVTIVGCVGRCIDPVAGAKARVLRRAERGIEQTAARDPFRGAPEPVLDFSARAVKKAVTRQQRSTGRVLQRHRPIRLRVGVVDGKNRESSIPQRGAVPAASDGKIDHDGFAAAAQPVDQRARQRVRRSDGGFIFWRRGRHVRDAHYRHRWRLPRTGDL